MDTLVDDLQSRSMTKENVFHFQIFCIDKSWCRLLQILCHCADCSAANSFVRNSKSAFLYKVLESAKIAVSISRSAQEWYLLRRSVSWLAVRSKDDVPFRVMPTFFCALSAALVCPVSEILATSLFKSALSRSVHVSQMERVKRQAHRASNATDPDKDPDICVVKCLRSTEEKLGALQVEDTDKQKQSPLSPQSALSRDYDPKDFQKLCE